MQIHEKSFLLPLEINFSKKNAKTCVMALVKNEILISREVLYAKSCSRDHFLFCKKMLSKILIFLV